MVSVTERVIHLEKQLENTAKKDIVERHDRDVRTMQTSLTQIRAQVVQLERLYLNEGRSGPGEISSGKICDVNFKVYIMSKSIFWVMKDT
jgi:hypothetical protein